MPKELSPRSLIIGISGSVIITASSMYVALKIGALPWPTIFVAIVSMSVLRLLGGTDLKEINVTHTAMSAGAMVAGGLAFTMPALWILNPDAGFRFSHVLITTLCGTILGLAATSFCRRYFIGNDSYAFPVGTAAFETVSAGGRGRTLWISMAASSVYTFLRDLSQIFPGRVLFPPLLSSKALNERGIPASIWLSPMAAGIGYIIGPLYTGIWALGAVIGYGILLPSASRMGYADPDAIRQSLGLGLMVGTGFGVLIRGILPKAKELFSGAFRKGPGLLALPAVLLLLIFGTEIRTLGPVAAVVVLITAAGALVASVMAAVLTGQTGINPMEILGILVLLTVKLLIPHMNSVLIITASVTAIAAGLSGDMMNDYKAGFLFGTDPKAQRTAETAGALTGAFISTAVLFIIIRSYGTDSLGQLFPAPQSQAVAAMAGGLSSPWLFWSGVTTGALLFILKIPSMTLGLGIYLPVFLTAPVFLGGLTAFTEQRIRKTSSRTGTLIASGVLGGEAVTGVILAMIAMFLRI